MNNIAQNKRNNSLDPITDCLDHMAAHGLPFPAGKQFKLTNRYERYSADEKETKIDEWYIGQEDEDGVLVTYGSWSTGEKYVFYSWNDESDSQDIQYKRQLKMQEQRRIADAALEEQYFQASIRATDCFSKFIDNPDEEALKYCADKGINPVGVKFSALAGNALMIPIRDATSKLWSLQFIFYDKTTLKNEKRFLKGGKRIGTFHVINDEPLKDGLLLYICEGWATGVSIYEAIKSPDIRVVAAMSMGNITKTIETIKSVFNCSYIICADGSPKEKEAANEAAKRFGCKVVYPDCTIGKDFNDVHKQYDLYTVKKQLENTIEFESNIEIAKKLAANLLNKEDPCADFNLNNMPEILRNHVLELCCANSAHHLAVLSSLLVGASAAIGKRFIIERDEEETEGYFGRLYCNLWVLSIAPSGQFKSTSLNLGSRYIQEHRQMVHKFTQELTKQLSVLNDQQQEEIKQQIQVLESSNIMFPDRMTPAALLQLLGRGRAGAMSNSEFGAFLKELTQPGNVGLMGLLTKFYDCDPLSEDATKTQGCNYIERPFISINGVSTLAWIKNGFSDEDVQGGFGARFLLFLLPKIEGRPPLVPRRKYTPVRDTFDKYRERLQGIPYRRYRIKSDAVEYYEYVGNKLYDIKESFDNEASEILDPYLRRWCPYIYKIAMIMQYFFDKDSEVITIEAIKAAYDYMLPAVKSTIVLFRDELGDSKFEKDCQKIFKWICTQVKENGCPVSHEKLNSSKSARTLTPKERDDIIRILEESGRIKINRDKSGSKTKNTYEIVK